MSGLSVNKFQTAFKQQKKVTDNSTPVINVDEKKGMSTGAKVAMGAGLTALAAVGIYLVTRRSPQKIIKNFDKPLSEYNLTKTPEKVKNAGKTVQETIENVFGKAETEIKPHTYDLAKEFDTIPTYHNWGGFKESWATTKGTFQHCQLTNDLGTGCGVREKAISHLPEMNGKSVHVGNGCFDVMDGYVPDCGNRVVRLDILSDKTADGSGAIPKTLSFISPNAELTPLQKDLLKLAENADSVGEDMVKKFDQIMEWRIQAWCRMGRNFTNEEMFANNCIHDSLDYDLILSTIQSLAKRIK